MCDVLVNDFPSHLAQSQQHSGNWDFGILYSPGVKEEIKQQLPGERRRNVKGAVFTAGEWTFI